ncbi:MAG: gamma-glutamyltransferase [Pararhodobacter sp.]|nr:gamma-glutamyltransferase [Pararhodobacter sp.]
MGTRVEVLGWMGVASTSHWLSSQTALAMLERGGNAFDAAVAAGLVMQVVQPHLNGPAGDVAILVHDGASGTVASICGQGPAPAGLNIAAIRALGLDMIPGTGLLPAVVPGAFDAWMMLLLEKGTIDLAEALAPAILYATRGIPVDPRLHETLSAAVPVFAKYWPASGAAFLNPDGTAPAVGALFANPTLAATWTRLLREAQACSPDRDAQIEAARAIWSDGFIAGAIDSFCGSAHAMDISGAEHGAKLRGSDMSQWRASWEPVVSLPYAGGMVYKCGGWTQGPALLQALAMLPPDQMAAMEPAGAAFIHQVTEAVKLALADRDSHYGESPVLTPRERAVLMAQLLSPDYAAQRACLIGANASSEFRPGAVPGQDWRPDFASACLRQRDAGILAAYGGGEPTVRAMPESPAGGDMANEADALAYRVRAVGDTSCLSVADAQGNVVSATPSGGWLQSSPVIAELGFPLGTRAQMMWLEAASPSGLAPGTRPRTTLTPTLATRPDGRVTALGTPGGDQQEQWQAAFLIRHMVQGLSLQDAIDAPGFHTNQVINSFYPRGAIRDSLVVEDRLAPGVVEALRERGHKVTLAGPWAEGRLCALEARAGGTLRAAATCRGGQSLAIGR